MTRIMRLMAGAFVVVSVLALGVAPISAHGFRFRRLSDDHTNYGVSQFLATTMNTTEVSVLVRLLNPNRVAQVAAVLVYDRSRGAFDTENIPGRFKSCVVRYLTPHAAVGIRFDEFPDLPDLPPFQELTPAYGEIISAPVHKVRVSRRRRTRLADGLGILAYAGASEGERAFLALHPKLFTPPQNKDFAPTQREVAIECILEELEALGLSERTFKDFGIKDGQDD